MTHRWLRSIILVILCLSLPGHYDMGQALLLVAGGFTAITQQTPDLEKFRHLDCDNELSEHCGLDHHENMFPYHTIAFPATAGNDNLRIAEGRLSIPDIVPAIPFTPE